MKNLKNPSHIANNISSNLNIQIFEKQELLEIVDLKKRLEKIHTFIEKETSVISVEKKIRGRVKNQMEKTQREYYLNEQLKAIQKELGEIEEGKDELKQIDSTSELKRRKSEGDEAAKVLGAGHAVAWEDFLVDKGLKKRK